MTTSLHVCYNAHICLLDIICGLVVFPLPFNARSERRGVLVGGCEERNARLFDLRRFAPLPVRLFSRLS
jgi:hypothetical protein